MLYCVLQSVIDREVSSKKYLNRNQIQVQLILEKLGKKIVNIIKIFYILG